MVIGLTGGIASGKTLVASMLQEKGAHIISADAISRDLLGGSGSPVLELIREAFGDGVFQPDGTVDRRALANIVFETEFERKRLEAILHPLVVEEIFKRIYKLKRAGAEFIVLDAALLIESGLYKCMDKVWVVISSEQMDRLIKRDQLSEAEAKKRMDAQLDDERRLRHADAFIDNSFGMERTQEQVDELWNQVKGGKMADG